MFAWLAPHRDWLFIKVGPSGELDQDRRRQQSILLTARLCRYLPLHLIKYSGVRGHSRLAELDQVLVRGPRMEATDVQVCFAQLFPSPTAAVATAVGVGTGGRHLVAGGHIGLLQRETQTQDFSFQQTRDRSSNFSDCSRGDKGNKLRCRR